MEEKGRETKERNGERKGMEGMGGECVRREAKGRKVERR